jgi:hypothetical protein
MTAAWPFMCATSPCSSGPSRLRLPFRFGAATVTRCPQAFVRVGLDVGGRRFEGASAELMVPKWFDKSPELTHEQNFEQLREALRGAREAYAAAGAAASPWQLSQVAGDAAIDALVARGLPRLAAQFGPALLDKAVADAALRAAGQGWCERLARRCAGRPMEQPRCPSCRHSRSRCATPWGWQTA